jgi:hypothetical protein
MKITTLGMFEGTSVLWDTDGMINLTDLWKGDGSPTNKEPWNWVRQDGTQELLKVAAEELKVTKSQIYRTHRGKHGGGTWAHKYIAQEYNRYLLLSRNASGAPEKPIADALAYALDGQREVATPAGYIDILTEYEVIETKQSSAWKSAIGQVLVYREYYPEHAARIHLFGDCACPRELVERHGQLLGIDVTWHDELIPPPPPPPPPSTERQLSLWEMNQIEEQK